MGGMRNTDGKGGYGWSGRYGWGSRWLVSMGGGDMANFFKWVRDKVGLEMESIIPFTSHTRITSKIC